MVHLCYKKDRTQKEINVFILKIKRNNFTENSLSVLELFCYPYFGGVHAEHLTQGASPFIRFLFSFYTRSTPFDDVWATISNPNHIVTHSQRDHL